MELYVKSMGEHFLVTAICTSINDANAILSQDHTQGVITEIQGIIFLAENDKTVTPPKDAMIWNLDTKEFTGMQMLSGLVQ
jgi:hypothetical protein